MSDIKPDDLFLINREGKDYKATVDQFAKDIHINVDACCEDPNDGKLTIKDDEDNVLGEFTANQEGDTEVVIPAGGGDGLDCDGLVDCFNNAPIDPMRFAVALETMLEWYADPSDQPQNWPKGQEKHSIHSYANLCDPVTHEVIPFDQEGHGHSGLDGSIFRLPHGYYEPTSGVITTCPPTSYLEDQEEVYGAHPPQVFLEDLKQFNGRYDKGITTTEDLFTTGILVNEEEHPDKILFGVDRCDSFGEDEDAEEARCLEDDFEDGGKYFHRLEFKYKHEFFKMVVIVNHWRPTFDTSGGSAKQSIVDQRRIPNFKINTSEHN